MKAVPRSSSVRDGRSDSAATAAARMAKAAIAAAIRRQAGDRGARQPAPAACRAAAEPLPAREAARRQRKTARRRCEHRAFADALRRSCPRHASPGRPRLPLAPQTPMLHERRPRSIARDSPASPALAGRHPEKIHVRHRRHPLCPLAHRLSAHRRRAHRAVQLALCAPHRAARCCCASRTPTASARPKRRPPRSSTG